MDDNGRTRDEPLVSILTPSLNQAPWLRDNLRSVGEQTYPRIEHIIVDGGSTDGTTELLRAQGSRVRWVSEPDRGQSHALNKAFEMSRGDIIGWINSDDAYFDRDVIATVVDRFRDSPDADMVYGHSVLTESSGKIVCVQWAPVMEHRLLLLGQYLTQPAVFLRRRALPSPLVVEDRHYAMDRELFLRIASRSQLARIDKIVAIDRKVPNRKSMDLEAMRQDHLAVDAEWLAPRGMRARILRRIFWGVFVLRGVAMTRSAARGGLASPPVGWMNLLLRQLWRGVLILLPLPWRWASP